jgi:hypothetical protein
VTRDRLLVRVLLAGYPARWRERYGDEFAAVLADMVAASPCRARARLIINALSGAVDARLNPPGGRTMTDRIRGSIATAACAAIAFAIAGAGFQKMTEYQDFRAAARQHAAVAASFNVLRAAAVLAGIAVLAGALPLAWSVVRQAIAGRRADLIWPLAVPPVAVAGWVAVTVLITRLDREPLLHSAVSDSAAAAVGLLGLAAAGACAWAVVAIMRRADLAPRLLRPEVIPMAVLSACMAVVTATDLSWGLALRAADGALFHSDDGLVATSLPLSWAAGVAVLAAATAVTAAATWRAAGQLRAAAQ